MDKPLKRPRIFWPEIIPKAVKLRSEGHSVKEIARRLGINYLSLRAKLILVPAPPVQAVPITPPSAPLPPADPVTAGASLDASRIAARMLLHNALTGASEVSAQQIAAARLVLKDELEPERVNPYSGIPEAELAERCIVMACSIMGVERVSEILRQLAHEGMADVMSMTPDVRELIDRPGVVMRDAEGETVSDGVVEDVMRAPVLTDSQASDGSQSSGAPGGVPETGH